MADDIDDILAGAADDATDADDAGLGDLLGGDDAGSDDAGGLDALLGAADAAAAPAVAGGPAPAAFGAPAGQAAAGDPAKMEEILRDVPVKMRVEFGRKSMLIKDILRLNAGRVIELDRHASDPVHLYVNHHLIGEGEIMVQKDDTFCVRITKLYESGGG